MSLFAASSNPSLSRTRSLRLQGKHPLTAPLSQQQPPPPSPLNSHAPAAGTAGTGQSGGQSNAAAIPSSTSNLALFLTNLRLLDLDLEADWPDITAATFSTRDAAGGQKKRIQAVEWTLYQLFVLWDPSETHNKLRPFFPPLDQVQSVNLRAALTRSLEQLKRNGSLGRDAIIRKTMLDECKGERLEEVLAAFSSAVLKKLVAERGLNSGPEYHAPVAEKLAVENRGYAGERTELNGLLLAHKAVLAGALARKNEMRERYRDFEELLELKQRGLVRRREQVKVSAFKDDTVQLDDETREQARDILRANWTGNESWVDALLYGGADVRPSTLLDAPFDQVWTGVQEGRLSDLEEQGSDLLGNLDSRVHLHRSRLEKWETFHHKMFGAQKAAPVTPKRRDDRPRRIIEFRSHKHVQLNGAKHKLREAGNEMPAEYEQIMLDMDHELGNVGQAKIPNFAKMFGSTAARLGATALAPEPVVPEQVSDLSEWEDEPERPAPKHNVASEQHMTQQPTQTDKREISPQRRLSVRSIPARQNSYRLGRPRKASVQEYEAEFSPPEPEAFDVIHQETDFAQETPTPLQRYAHPDSYDQVHSPVRGDLYRPEPELPVPPSPPPPASPTQAAADEILAYMSNASPSPLKKSRHTLSLAERTRLSMTRTQPFEADKVDSSRLSPTKADYPTIVEESADPVEDDVGAYQSNPHEDLIARTRRSMAGFEAARQKAQLERRRSQRRSKVAPRRDGSYFPRLDEEENNGVGDTSVVDELLLQVDSGAPDYEAVFRSRPKIKTSPAASPMRLWAEEE
ncbi:HAUS augmin-like complex subunit 6 N-terminus-domain-containing protein [Microdochium trichocladiopsis]|uniref:HAUS augmin-like complex subunit 6 N-terminus-domain-containing protein n=1 Tax=Microdochium trichocladiopsis TaxID=1682393 RepID=A0A9P9BR30_9PEZI|nr:HAUS augmin-like complex subunit 6 N-terminus-domain-containing protein [Microdochium trichocladiopsis]KAH7031517.1 HAUS augmin-like complex subunit 6 N-terminus-domain-containing protein [Microdochium trichocladiopsis]